MKDISRQTIKRLPVYLNYLKTAEASVLKHVSATTIADALNINRVVVRKDLACVSSSGRPKIGYVRLDLENEIETYLGYNSVRSAVIVGAGKLGSALLAYEGFKNYGLDIIAAFDIDTELVHTEVFGKTILPLEKLKEVCTETQVKIGIITVPAICSQEICDLLVQNGIRAIWNFAPNYLEVPQEILVQNEDMAVTLALLSSHLKNCMTTE